jgi:glutaconate CoA-transferase subunit B
MSFQRDELMNVAAARELQDRTVCFVRIGLPSTAANLARLTHAPRTVLIYEPGTIGSKPSALRLSIEDGELAKTADAAVCVPEIFNYWLQAGRVDVGFLGAAQIDRWDLRTADDLEETEPPSQEELRTLRELRSALEEVKA